MVGTVLAEATSVDWRVILGSSTLLAIILFVARIGLPESPRWQWNVGSHEDARRIAHRYQ